MKVCHCGVVLSFTIRNDSLFAVVSTSTFVLVYVFIVADPEKPANDVLGGVDGGIGPDI